LVGPRDIALAGLAAALTTPGVEHEMHDLHDDFRQFDMLVRVVGLLIAERGRP